MQQSLDPMAAAAAEWISPRRQEPATAFSSNAVPWPDAAADRLVELLKLPVGWDGHDARPVSRAVADYATYLLPRIARPGMPAPFIAPLSSGALQLEWHRNGWDLEIEIHAPGKLYAYAREQATGVEWERDLTDDFSEIGPMLEAVRG
jgi:hypothetical protein